MTKKKGDCYRVAAHYLIDDDPKEGRSLFVCHGVATGQGPIAGVRFGHAWVEWDLGDATFVIDQSNGLNVFMHRDRYYEIGKINPKEVVRYDREALRHTIHDHGTYGPWHDDGVQV